MISAVPQPSAVASMIRARQTCFCGLFRSATIRSSRSRSAALTSMLIPSRMPQHATLSLKRESYDCVRPLAGARLLWHHRGRIPTPRAYATSLPGRLDRVVSVSQFAAPKPVCSRRPAKGTVVHSPFDTDEPGGDRSSARGSLLEGLGCRPGTRVIGFFGNMMARKRPLMLVDTIAEMRARAPDLPLAAPIFGEDREDLTEAIKDRARARGVAAAST